MTTDNAQPAGPVQRLVGNITESQERAKKILARLESVRKDAPPRPPCSGPDLVLGTTWERLIFRYFGIGRPPHKPFTRCIPGRRRKTHDDR